MPPAPWWDGQCASLLIDSSGGEILGAALLGQAPGLCPQVVASCWPSQKKYLSSSIFFSGASGHCCCLATKMQMSEKVADIHLPLCFFLKEIFESPSHSCLPMEKLSHFSSNGNFFLQSCCVAKGNVRCSVDSYIWGEKPQPNHFFLCSCKTKMKIGENTLNVFTGDRGSVGQEIFWQIAVSSQT